MKGQVGQWRIFWESVPSGEVGAGVVEVNGERIRVSWEKDQDGIWIEFEDSVCGFDLEGVQNEDEVGVGSRRFIVRDRKNGLEWENQCFLREGEDGTPSGGSRGKAQAKIKAEMPGKIVDVLVGVGTVVEAGTPLLVMEAMKMENRILAPIAGAVLEVGIKKGDLVETGALLVVIKNESKS